LDLIVSQSQTAFIPNRSISENVLLAQELEKDYHKNKGQANAQLKWN
jgi:ABC-type lipoprotein export system ATPase subunit